MVMKEAFKRFEALEHNAKDGFYDAVEDMYFRTLHEWFSFTGFTWSDVAPH